MPQGQAIHNIRRGDTLVLSNLVYTSLVLYMYNIGVHRVHETQGTYRNQERFFKRIILVGKGFCLIPLLEFKQIL